MPVLAARVLRVLLPLLGGVACGAPSATDDPVGGGTSDTDTRITTTFTGGATSSSPAADDEGSIVLLRRRSPERDNASYLYGIFLDEAPDYLNTAQCAVAGVSCIEILPLEEDLSVPYDEDLAWEQPNATYRFLGATLTVGAYAMPYVYDEAADRGYYAAILSDDPLVYGEVPISIAGEWSGILDDANPGDDPTMLIDEDLDLLLPDYKFDVDFINGQPLAFEWVPTGTGDVYLIVEAVGISELHWLEDDGYAAFFPDELGFETDDLDVEFTLSRWTTREHAIGPHALRASSVSEIVMRGRYTYVGASEEITLVDQCSVAEVLPVVTESGSYYGVFGDWFQNDLSPGYEGCTGYAEDGEEGIIPVRLEPNSILTAVYSVSEGDASIYLLQDCEKTSTCLVGADLDVTIGGTEYLTYFNQTAEPMDLFLVLDGWWVDGAPGLGASLLEQTFELDLTIDVLEEPEMYDECLDAQLQSVPLGEGTYYTETFPYTGLINPGGGGCTGTSVPGPDSISKVVIENGQTLTATLSMTGGDGAIYLMYNCVNPASCAIGSDTSTVGAEGVAYTNLSGAPATLYLVVDTKDVLGPYFLTIDLEP